MLANETISTLVRYIAATSSLGMEVGDLKSVQGDNVDVVSGVEQVCSQLAAMIDAGTPPDVVLDTTKAGDFSDPVKSLTKSLGLPSVALSFGEARTLKEWNDLNEKQMKYLIQIRPPADPMTDVIRTLAMEQNLTNAAILHDDSFGKIKESDLKISS